MVRLFIAALWMNKVEIDIPIDLNARVGNDNRARQYVNESTARTQPRKVQ
jgi:hypothetical protein